jgi:hypothetical protein
MSTVNQHRMAGHSRGFVGGLDLLSTERRMRFGRESVDEPLEQLGNCVSHGYAPGALLANFT